MTKCPTHLNQFFVRNDISRATTRQRPQSPSHSTVCQNTKMFKKNFSTNKSLYSQMIYTKMPHIGIIVFNMYFNILTLTYTIIKPQIAFHIDVRIKNG